jgi:hypothetical protein
MHRPARTAVTWPVLASRAQPGRVEEYEGRYHRRLCSSERTLAAAGTWLGISLRRSVSLLALHVISRSARWRGRNARSPSPPASSLYRSCLRCQWGRARDRAVIALRAIIERTFPLDGIVATPVAISKPDNNSEKLIYAVADIDAMKAHAAQRKPEADVEIAEEHPPDRSLIALADDGRTRARQH